MNSQLIPTFGDVNKRTLRVIDIISSWTVNTFYNYLHEEAVARHSRGQAGSITDGYRQMVKAYLDTFAHQEGYSKIVISLHKYYCDAEKQAMLALDEWVREVLGQFIPDDYKSIMTNNQRYDLLRTILINSIEQFSADVICTPMFDILISNHDEPSLVPRMKTSMRGMLLAERQNVFSKLHRAAVGGTTQVGSSMKNELGKLVEENVLLKSKNAKLVTSVKKALDGMKVRDQAINALNADLRRAQAEITRLTAATSGPAVFPTVANLLPPPKTMAEEFKSSIESAGFPVLRPAKKVEFVDHRARPEMSASKLETIAARAESPKFSQVQKLEPVPLTQNEHPPEAFEMADPVEDALSDHDEPEPYTGSDTLALNMDEFMNG